MCEQKLSFHEITAQSPDKAEVEAIFNEAFPERERPYSFDTLLRMCKDSGTLKVAAASMGGPVIGLICYAEFDTYTYLVYFAVNSALRGGGYGSKLIRGIVEAFPGKEVLGCIETPIPGTSNYDQRVKRKVFYERVGIFMTKFSYGRDAESMLTFVSTRPEEMNRRDIGAVGKIAKDLLGCMPGQVPEGLKVFVVENGVVVEQKAVENLL